MYPLMKFFTWKYEYYRTLVQLYSLLKNCIFAFVNESSTEANFSTAIITKSICFLTHTAPKLSLQILLNNVSPLPPPHIKAPFALLDHLSSLYPYKISRASSTKGSVTKVISIYLKMLFLVLPDVLGVLVQSATDIKGQGEHQCPSVIPFTTRKKTHTVYQYF